MRLNAIVSPLTEFFEEGKGDALYAMELALSLEKLNYDKLLHLWEVGCFCGVGWGRVGDLVCPQAGGGLFQQVGAWAWRNTAWLALSLEKLNYDKLLHLWEVGCLGVGWDVGLRPSTAARWLGLMASPGCRRQTRAGMRR